MDILVPGQRSSQGTGGGSGGAELGGGLSGPGNKPLNSGSEDGHFFMLSMNSDNVSIWI